MFHPHKTLVLIPCVDRWDEETEIHVERDAISGCVRIGRWRYFGYTVRESVERYAEQEWLTLADNWTDGIDSNVLDYSDEYDETEAE